MDKRGLRISKQEQTITRWFQTRANNLSRLNSLVTSNGIGGSEHLYTLQRNMPKMLCFFTFFYFGVVVCLRSIVFAIPILCISIQKNINEQVAHFPFVFFSVIMIPTLFQPKIIPSSRVCCPYRCLVSPNTPTSGPHRVVFWILGRPDALAGQWKRLLPTHI